jgi:WD40 repeat protein
VVRINQNQVATRANDGLVKVWDIGTGALVNTFYGHTANSAITSLAVLPNGMLASGNQQDKTVRVWDVQNNLLSTVINLGSGVTKVIMNPLTGQLLVGMPGTLAIYNPATMVRVSSMSISGSWWNMAVLPATGNLMLVGASTYIYNISSGSLLFSFANPSTAIIVVVLPDQVTAVTGHTTTGNLGLFNTSSTGVLVSVAAHSDSVYVVSVTPDQFYVISAAMDSTLKFWTWAPMSLTLLKTYTVDATPFSGTVFLPAFTGSEKLCIPYLFKCGFMLKPQVLETGVVEFCFEKL